MTSLFQNAKIGIIDTSGQIINSTSGNVSFAARPFVNGTGLLLSGEAAPSGIYGSQWTTTGSKIYYNSGNIGINNSNPLYKLDISGTIGNSNGGLDFATSGIQLLVTGGTNSGVNTGIIGIWISGVSPSIPNPYTGAPQIGWIAQFPNDLTLPNRIARVTGSEFANTSYWRIYFDSSFVISYPHTYYSNPNVNIIPYGGGNVGIANNNPQYTLDVSGMGNFSSGLYVNRNPVSTGEPIAISLSGSVVLLTGRQNVTGAKTFNDAVILSGTAGSNSIILSGNGTAVFSNGAGAYSNFLPGVFTVNDNAGSILSFGNTAGGGSLSVQSDATFSKRPIVNGTGVLLVGEAVSQWGSYGSAIYYDAGSVGINTSTPSFDLDVNGTIGNSNGPVQITAYSSSNIDLYASSDIITFSSADGDAGALTFALYSLATQVTSHAGLELYAGDVHGYNTVLYGGVNEDGAGGNVVISAGDGSTVNGNIQLLSTVGINTSSPSASYALDVNGDIYCNGKITAVGGVDPPYVLFDLNTRQSVKTRVLAEVPIDKQSGAAQFWNLDTKKMEVYIASEDKFYDLNGNLLQ
jgi:hypothetical protein